MGRSYTGPGNFRLRSSLNTAMKFATVALPRLESKLGSRQMNADSTLWTWCNSGLTWLALLIRLGRTHVFIHPVLHSKQAIPGAMYTYLNVKIVDASTSPFSGQSILRMLEEHATPTSEMTNWSLSWQALPNKTKTHALVPHVEFVHA